MLLNPARDERAAPYNEIDLLQDRGDQIPAKTGEPLTVHVEHYSNARVHGANCGDEMEKVMQMDDVATLAP